MPGPLWNPRLVFALVTLLCAPAQPSQTGPTGPPAVAPASPLPANETLYYTIEWRLITAGKAKVTWSANPQPTHPGWQVNLHLESTGLVSRLFKVDDNYTANMSAELCALNTHMIVHEGSRHRETSVTFDSQNKKASYLERDLVKQAVVAKETDISACVHDVIGGLAFLRTLSLEPGRSIQVPVSDGKKYVLVKVEAQGREEIKTRLGAQRTLRYEVLLFNEVLYRRSGHLHVWLTDDRRKLPVRLEVRLQFAIGTITFQLEKEERT